MVTLISSPASASTWKSVGRSSHEEVSRADAGVGVVALPVVRGVRSRVGEAADIRPVEDVGLEGLVV